jgi:D-xylose transport system substrate-binding protein
MCLKYLKPFVVFVMLFSLCLNAQGQKAGFLLGSFVSDRWYLDQKLFADRVEELGGSCIIDIAYDPAEQLTRARKLLDDGVDVLVVVPLDAKKAADIAELCKSRNVPIVSYDRLILSNDISVYISYNNEKVGRLQAEYFVQRLPDGNYFLINGPVTDNNAILFRNGQLSVLAPYIASGKIKVVEDYVMENWSEINAFEKTKEYFNAGREHPDVVLAANDALANGVIQALPPELAGKVMISGQDADLVGIRNLLSGFQTMTVYKPIRPLAYMAAEMAVDLARKKKVGGTERFFAGKISVDAVLLDPVVVDVNNYRETVVNDGHVSMSEVVKNLGKAFEAERNRSQLALLQKEKALETERKEHERNIFVGIILFFIVSMAGLAFNARQKQKDNRLLSDQKRLIEKKNAELVSVNQQLTHLNEKLVHQKEEMSAQRDAIAEQKEKLEEVNTIIALQKDEIQHQNERLEKEVQKRTAELIQYIRQLEQYSFVTAHNLRAPVARIIGLCQLIKMQLSDPDEVRVMTDKLIISGQELDLVFRELNAILDIRTFSMEIFSRVSLEDEWKNILGHLKYEIEQSQAVIEAAFQVQTINSIKPYVHSILFNLLSNALKYRHPTRQPHIKISSASQNGRIFLTVADNGLGINTDYLDKIFQLYKRFHFHVEGRGVGLFLVKTQVDSLGGNIEIQSEVDKGTVITIWLDE